MPIEYRPAVEDGIREWNKAFEKIGFRDAIAVRWQEPNRDDFDPEDINYCTFRWIATNSHLRAMSCLRSNPITGEMIDGDVIFDAELDPGLEDRNTPSSPASRGRRCGRSAGESDAQRRSARSSARSGGEARAYGQLDLGPVGLDPNFGGSRTRTSRWSRPNGRGFAATSSSGWPTASAASCRFSTGMRPELGLAALAMADGQVKGDDTKLEAPRSSSAS